VELTSVLGSSVSQVHPAGQETLPTEQKLAQKPRFVVAFEKQLHASVVVVALQLVPGAEGATVVVRQRPRLVWHVLPEGQSVFCAQPPKQ